MQIRLKREHVTSRFNRDTFQIIPPFKHTQFAASRERERERERGGGRETDGRTDVQNFADSFIFSDLFSIAGILASILLTKEILIRAAVDANT